MDKVLKIGIIGCGAIGKDHCRRIIETVPGATVVAVSDYVAAAADDTAAKYGDEQVKIWRRSFDVCPPELTDDDERNPKNQAMYKNVDPSLLPNTESLETCIARVVPYYKDVITKDIADGKKVLIAAHGNSLRSLVMYLDDMTPEQILETNIPTAVPLVYELDDNFKAISHHYLLSDEELKARMDAVANQGKAK